MIDAGIWTGRNSDEIPAIHVSRHNEETRMNAVATITEDENMIRSTMQSLANKLVEASSLAKEVAELRADVERLTILVGTLVAERDEMRQERDRAKEDLEVAHRAWTEKFQTWIDTEECLRDDITCKNVKIEKLEHDNDSYTKEIVEVRTQLSHRDDLIHQHELTIHHAKEYATKLEEECAGLSARLDMAEQLVKSWQDSSAGLFEEMLDTLFPPRVLKRQAFNEAIPLPYTENEVPPSQKTEQEPVE